MIFKTAALFRCIIKMKLASSSKLTGLVITISLICLPWMSFFPFQVIATSKQIHVATQIPALVYTNGVEPAPEGTLLSTRADKEEAHKLITQRRQAKVFRMLQGM